MPETLGNFYFDVIFRDADSNSNMEKELRDRIDRISKEKLHVGIDLTEFNTQITKVREELKNLGSMGTTAFDASRFAQMQKELEGYADIIQKVIGLLKESGDSGMEGLKKRAAESAENSYNKLLLKLKEVEAEYNKLDAKSAAPTTGAQGARGQELLSQIQALRGALREIDALKKSVNSIGDNEGMQRWSKAFAEAEFAASSTGKSIALLKAQTAATNKETVEAARVADMARGSYDQLRAELDKTIAEYKAMSEAVRGTKKGSDTLAYIHELQSQIKAIDDAIKPVQQKLSKLQQLQNQLAELNTVGSTAQSEIEAQHAVSLAKERVKLETEYINIKDRGAASDEIYVQNLRQEVALMKQLEALQVQRRNLADPNSDERKVLALQQEIALQREQLSLENQRARLQMQLTHYSQYGQEEADLREELRIKKELAEIDSRLYYYNTAEAEDLRQKQQQLALLQRQEQLERERVRLQERLQALQSGQDHENMALKTKVQLEEQLARLRAKRTWLGQTNGSGVTNAEEMKRLNREIRELTSNASTAETRVRDVNRAYRQGVPLLQSLVNLARNYVGVWGLWSGLRSLYRIRAEFERQEVALRALMQSASQAREVMGQLQQMALKSPFSVSDIVSFSKQLSAFSIGNNELVETTKRLADLSAGLGVDMSRLILAYGQVKAATVLRGQELRQFTEAGVPMVQALADQFTKLEGRVVTAADVFDRISKKAVSFEMVKKVLDSMTSEGGRFYDHQAKMVETLYGKMERLGDAYKVMMNNLGKANDALLKWPIDAITNAMMNWRSTLGFLLSAAIAGGLYKMQRAYGGIAQAAAAAGKSTGAFMKSMAKGPLWVFLLAEVATKFIEIHESAKALNEEIRKLGEDLRTDVDEFLKVNDAVIKVQIEGGDTNELDKIWEKLRDEVAHISGSGIKLQELIDIQDLKKRCEEALKYLHSVSEAGAALQNAKDINVPQGFWFFSDGLVDNLKTAVEYYKTLVKYYNTPDFATAQKATGGGDALLGQMKYDLAGLNDDIKEVAGSIKSSLQDAIKNGLDPNDQDAVREYIKGIIKSIESQNPDMDRAMRGLFETGLYSELGKIGVVVQDSVFESEAAVDTFIGYLRHVAHDTGQDLDAIINNLGSTNATTAAEAEKQFKQMCEKAYQHALVSADGMYNAYAAMISQLSRLEIVIRSRIIGPAGEVSNLQRDWDKRNPMTDQKYRPNKDETDQSYGQRMNQAKEQAKKDKNYARYRKQKARDAEERAHWAEEEAAAAKEEAGYTAQANIYYVDIDKHGDYKAPKPRKTGGGAKRDEWLDEVKNRLNEYKEARSEVEKLRKAGMSEAQAIAEVLTMAWSKDLDKQYLGEGGMNALVEYLLPFAKNHAKGLKGSFKAAADKFVLELQKLSNSESVTQMTEASKRLGDEIKKHIEVGVKQWKLYDTLFASTGDDAMSASVAFGGKKLFKNIEDQLIALFNQNAGGIDFSAALKMDDKTLRESLLKNADEYIDLLKRIKEMRESGWSDVMTAAAKAMEDQMSMEEKLQKQRMLNQKQLAEFIERNGGWMAVASNPELLSMYNALVKAGKEAIAELEAQAFELSDAWEQIFGDMTYKTYGQVKAARNLAEEIVRNATAASVGKDGRVKSYKSSYTDANGNLVELSNISPSQLERIKKAIDELFKTGKEKNAFATLGDTIKGIFETIRKGGKVSKETWMKLADGMSEVSKIGADLAGQLSDMFDAMGNEGMSETMDDLQAGLESVSNIGQGFAQGGLVGGIAAAAGEAIKWTTRLFRRHDAALQKIIENSKRKVAELQMSYEQVEKTIERILGGIYNARLDTAQRERLRNILEETKAVMGSDLTIHFEYVYSEESRAAAKKALSDGTAYSAMYANLLAQRDELNKQYDSESKKKKKDKDALIEYQKQIAELSDQIEHFAVDMANSLYGIDIKNWAKQLTDAVVNAWRNGEDAAEAYRNKVKDIVADVATSIIAQRVMEAALQPVLDSLVAEMTGKNGMLDEDTIALFAAQLGEAGNNAVSVITGILDNLKAQGYDLTSGSAAGTLGQGIKEITEDQANLLASYINAMRADLSVVRMLWEQHALGLSAVSQAQLTELSAISANTLRNADAAERIESALNSVITIGASGARLRV